MGTGAALQGWLGLHLPTAGVKGEDPIGAFPMVIPPTKDMDLPVTHSHSAALLGDKQKDKSILGSSVRPTWPDQTAESCLTDYSQGVWIAKRQRLYGSELNCSLTLDKWSDGLEVTHMLWAVSVFIWNYEG